MPRSAILAYARSSADDPTCKNQRRTISARYAVAKWFADDGLERAIKKVAKALLERLASGKLQIDHWREKATAQAQGRSLLGQPTELLDRALKLEPDNGRALALAHVA